MQNAHLRMGVLEYRHYTSKIATHIRVRVDKYMGEDGVGHLLSVFGGDIDIGAISAAISEGCAFTLNMPDGDSLIVNMGEMASCYRGAVSLRTRTRPIRHLVAVSNALQFNGTAGKMFLLNYRRSLAWHKLTSLLGVPALPEWETWMMGRLEAEGRVKPLTAIGCSPAMIEITRDELLTMTAAGVRDKRLPFPAKNGPIAWPVHNVAADVLTASSDLIPGDDDALPAAA